MRRPDQPPSERQLNVLSNNSYALDAQPFAAAISGVLMRCILNMESKSDQKLSIMDALSDGIFSEDEVTKLFKILDLANA